MKEKWRQEERQKTLDDNNDEPVRGYNWRATGQKWNSGGNRTTEGAIGREGVGATEDRESRGCGSGNRGSINRESSDRERMPLGGAWMAVPSIPFILIIMNVRWFSSAISLFGC